MRYRLYFRNQFLSEHLDLEDAQAQARWDYFEFQSAPWEGENLPPGFLIAAGAPMPHLEIASH